MNEHKKTRYEYFNPTVSEQKQNAEYLLAQITAFIRKNKINVSDWILLDNMIKQLGQRKANLPRKVLRGMQNKFEQIQNKYQR